MLHSSLIIIRPYYHLGLHIQYYFKILPRWYVYKGINFICQLGWTIVSRYLAKPQFGYFHRDLESWSLSDDLCKYLIYAKWMVLHIVIGLLHSLEDLIFLTEREFFRKFPSEFCNIEILWLNSSIFMLCLGLLLTAGRLKLFRTGCNLW